MELNKHKHKFQVQLNELIYTYKVILLKHRPLIVGKCKRIPAV